MAHFWLPKPKRQAVLAISSVVMMGVMALTISGCKFSFGNSDMGRKLKVDQNVSTLYKADPNRYIVHIPVQRGLDAKTFKVKLSKNGTQMDVSGYLTMWDKDPQTGLSVKLGQKFFLERFEFPEPLRDNNVRYHMQKNGFFISLYRNGVKVPPQKPIQYSLGGVIDTGNSSPQIILPQPKPKSAPMRDGFREETHDLDAVKQQMREQEEEASETSKPELF